MTHIHDIIPEDLLDQEIKLGYVVRKFSEDGSKSLLIYSKLAQYENRWNEATKNARGLTFDTHTGEVLARTLKKFFNYGDSNAPEIGMRTSVWAIDKIDGSLAVLQPDGTMTSKGSFTSDVARAATRLYQEKYEGKWTLQPNLTYLFEFTSPEHRIVLDYGEKEELTLIAMVDNRDGCIYDTAGEVSGTWPGPRAQLIGHEGISFEEVLKLPPRENAEGLVLIWGKDNVLKLKQDDYVAMHAVVTNTSALRLWEILAVKDLLEQGADDKALERLLQLGPDRIEQAKAVGQGPDWVAELSGKVPDEFHDWMKNTLRELHLSFEDLHAEAVTLAGVAMSADYERKELVEFLRQKSPIWGLDWRTVLGFVDQTDASLQRAHAAIWKSIRPEGGRWGAPQWGRQDAEILTTTKEEVNA